MNYKKIVRVCKILYTQSDSQNVEFNNWINYISILQKVIEK